jgi:long-chain acyl-CoA synthetase
VQEVHNVADLVRRAAADRGDRPALRSHDLVITWLELDAQVDAVAAALSRLADGSDDHPARVAIALPNVPEFAALFFGALRAGLVAVPVNPGYTGRELRHVMTDCGARVLVGTAAVVEAIGDGRPVHTYVLGAAEGARPVADLITTAAAPAAGPSTGGDDLAVLLYTSGTAGAPKGAMLSHRALLANHAQLAEVDPPPVMPDDVLLLVLPLCHVYGLNSGLGAVAYHGACGVLVERFDPGDTLEIIERRGVSVVIAAPPMFVAWSLMTDRLARGWSSVRLAVSGAAPIESAAAERFGVATGKTVHQGYGLTETAPVLASTIASTAVKPGSIGRPIPGVELRLVDASGEDVDLDSDDDFDDDSSGSPGTDPGEIVVRGPNLFSGYWPDGSGGPDDDGWWATGDVAYADVDGDLFLVDRLGELILVSGFNVYPREVELVLEGHPGVSEAAALGMPHPYTGQTVKAFVVRSVDMVVSAEELLAYCERNLARFKCPTAIAFVDELPHSATGKVRKVALRGEG